MSALDSILGPVLRAGLTWLGRRRLPKIDGELSLAGLIAAVEIIRDAWGIPHIYAANTHDLFLAQGYVHAQDRLWQMEVNRRTASGHLSELFGELALDTDRATRTFGFQRVGQADWANADENVREMILAYTKGVNAFLQDSTSHMPVEFTLLRHRPEPWTPEDSTAFSRVMIWQLSHAWDSQFVRAQVVEAVGQEHAAELEIRYPEGNPLTLPAGIEFNRLDANGALRAARGPFLKRGIGSNGWAIAGARTTTGGPFLCNDMHLALALPSLWYEAHLVADGFNVTGFTLPGLPGVMVGHNAHIAWGMTLAFTDCEDLYVERFDPQAPHRYQFGQEWLDAEVIREPINVKGRAEPHVEEVIVTRHGPVISGVVGYANKGIAVQSMALRPCPALRGWWLLNQARDWNEFVEAARLIESPQLNVPYADVEGNIGYWVTGKVPVRAKGQGLVPAAGWTGEYEWVGKVPFEEMPHALNPRQGFVVSCNHRIVPDDYPHFLGSVWMNGYRARRITEIIQSRDRLSADDFCAIQLDFACIPGQEFVKCLEGLSSEDQDVQMGLDLLRRWDGQLTAESIGGTVYEVTRRRLVRNLLEPGLGAELSARVMGLGFHPLLKSTNEFYGHDTIAILRMLGDPDSWWVEQAGGQDAVLPRSLKQAVQWLWEELGPDVRDWQWGRIHRAVFPHAMGIQKPLDQVFNRGPLPIGGDTDTPCQTGILPGQAYDNDAWAPSTRMVADMSDLSRSLAMHAPGQSGQLGSAHYDDLADLWIKGEYHPMLWTREQVESEAEGTLRLEPSGP